MNGKQFFFQHVVRSKLTGEQLRVLMCMLTVERDGDIGIKQTEIAEMLEITESNVSRSIKALIEAGLLSKTVSRGFDGRPVWIIDKSFEQKARDMATTNYIKTHGKNPPVW